jgi:hypothetical protein
MYDDIDESRRACTFMIRSCTHCQCKRN